MNYRMGSGIIRLKIHKSFEDIFEVPCASKFSAFRSSVCFEVLCGNHILHLCYIYIYIRMHYISTKYYI